MPINSNQQIINIIFNYKWFEKKTIASGANTINLTSVVPTGGKLKIIDEKYGQEWFEGIHWNRSGQMVTLTSSLPESLTFQIWCFVAS